jgi:hypothetical protein
VFSVIALVVLAASIATYFWSLTIRGGIAGGIAHWLFAIAGVFVAFIVSGIGAWRGEGRLAQGATCGAVLCLVYILANS